MEWAKIVLEYLKVLIWPIVVILISWSFKEQICGVLNRLRKADLPGGVSIDFQEEIKQAKYISEKIEAGSPPQGKKYTPMLPLTEANARMIKLNLRPSPSGLDFSYYRNIAIQDSTLALAGLRIEIDVILKNVAMGFKVEIKHQENLGRLIRRLYDAAAITIEQTTLIQKILNICNTAIHNGPISKEQADAVIDLAEGLAQQYLAWLSWGFKDGWVPSQ